MRYIVVILLLKVLLTPVHAQQTIDEITKEGIALHDSGNYKSAIEKYKEALAIDPASGLVNYEIAFSYQLSGDLESALKHIDNALQQQGDETLKLNAYIVKGSIIDERGDPEEAIEVYEEALKKFPDAYLLLFNYAVSCGRVGKVAEAEEALIHGLSREPNHPGSHLQLAAYESDQKRRVQSVLGLYYFLLLENNTQRATDAFNKLQQLFYQGIRENKQKSDGNVINLSFSEGGTPYYNSAEMMLSILAAGSLSSNKTKSLAASFGADTGKFFSVLGEIKESEKKKKQKRPAEPDDFWRSFYVPFFYEMEKAGHTEAFTAYISQAQGDATSKAWPEQNKEKMEFFFLWLNTH